VKTVFLILALLLAMGTAAPAASADDTGALRVTIEGLRNNDGVVRVALYNNSEGFPSQTAKALSVVTIRPVERRAVTIFNDLPFGTYAVAVLHDENENGKVDTNFLGIPREGVGASRDAPATFGPPKYDDAAFPLNVPRRAIRIRLRYL